jgi:uncharacterized protein YdeI (YjbR/CyaY-like superfamily)
MNPKVDHFIDQETKWQEEFKALRAIALDCQLNEDLKWGVPCYTHQGANVALIHGFKEYCAILFVKGSLLKDPKKLLITQTENVQAGRQVRFTTLDQITQLAPDLKAYLQEAVEVEKAGLKVPAKKTADYPIPEEFQARLDADPAVKKAFESLTPGRQRGYLLHFAAPKQAKTREDRVEKCLPKILAGKGLDD